MKTLTATQVCKDLGLQPFVLKFWEAEFDQLSSMVGDKRRYSAKAVKLVKRIQEWVEEENCDFDEVRERLGSTPAAAGRSVAAPPEPDFPVVDLSALRAVEERRDQLQAELDSERVVRQQTQERLSSAQQLLDRLEQEAAEQAQTREQLESRLAQAESGRPISRVDESAGERREDDERLKRRAEQAELELAAERARVDELETTLAGSQRALDSARAEASATGVGGDSDLQLERLRTEVRRSDEYALAELDVALAEVAALKDRVNRALAAFEGFIGDESPAPRITSRKDAGGGASRAGHAQSSPSLFRDA